MNAAARALVIGSCLVALGTLPGCCFFDLFFPPLCENCGGDTVHNADECRQCCSGLAMVEGYDYAGPGQCRCTGPGAGECR